jgi:hypothetical protein
MQENVTERGNHACLVVMTMSTKVIAQANQIDDYWVDESPHNSTLMNPARSWLLI